MFVWDRSWWRVSAIDVCLQSTKSSYAHTQFHFSVDLGLILGLALYLIWYSCRQCKGKAPVWRGWNSFSLLSREVPWYDCSWSDPWLWYVPIAFAACFTNYQTKIFRAHIALCLLDIKHAGTTHILYECLGRNSARFTSLSCMLCNTIANATDDEFVGLIRVGW